MRTAMWTNYYNPEEDKMYAFNLSVLPYISIPNETLKQMRDILEYESVGKIYEAVCDYIYEDKEPNLQTKAEKSFFNTLIEQITRLSSKYFKKLSTLKNQGGAVRILSSNVKKDNTCVGYCTFNNDNQSIDVVDTEDKVELGF